MSTFPLTATSPSQTGRRQEGLLAATALTRYSRQGVLIAWIGSKWCLVSTASIEFPSNGDTDAENTEEEGNLGVGVTKSPIEDDVPEYTNNCRDAPHVLKRS